MIETDLLAMIRARVEIKCWCCGAICTGLFRYEHPDFGDMPTCMTCATWPDQAGCTVTEIGCEIGTDGRTIRLPRTIETKESP